MGVYTIGDIICRTRKSLGITRKDLCEGICTIETLYRIESGERIPNRANYQALMERMGKHGEKYIPFLHSDEIDTIIKGNELELLLLSRKYEELSNKLIYFQHKLNINDNVNRQFIKRLQALVDYETKKINETEKRTMLVDALRYTVPRYQDGIVPICLFTRNEIMLLCNIAVSYAQEKKIKIALNMLTQIEQYFDNTNIDIEERAISETLALSNYAQCLGLNGETRKAIEKGEKAAAICIKTRKCGVLPNVLYNLAYENALLQNDKVIYTTIFKQALYVAELTDNTRLVKHITDHLLNMEK